MGTFKKSSFCGMRQGSALVKHLFNFLMTDFLGLSERSLGTNHKIGGMRVEKLANPC